MNNCNQHHKNLTGGSPKQSNIAGSFCPPIKKMITEVLLISALYLILFFIWWPVRHLIKTMADVGDILSDNEIFGDAVDTLNEGIEEHRKREETRARRIYQCINGHIEGWTGQAMKLLTKRTPNTSSMN